jgi:hypothetical protein
MDRRNVISASVAFAAPVADYSVYVGKPVDEWVDRASGVMFGLDLFRKLTPSLWAGAGLEFESLAAEDPASDSQPLKMKGWRTAGCLSSVGHFPDGLFSLEAGPVACLALIKPTSVTGVPAGDLETLFALEYGMFVGPALQLDRLRVAVHFQIMHSWAQGDRPKEITLADPHVRLRATYAF